MFLGDCVASVFPLNRREGPVTEVLMLDAKPNPRILTVQHRRMPHAVRLQGFTIKVWSAATLCSQKPLLVLYDVIKHLQLEDGRLFVWRIENDAIIRVRCSGGGGAGGEQDEEEAEECRKWTEHPSLRASVLDPLTLEVLDIPLDSTYGRRKTPFEWMDGGCEHCVAAAEALVAENRVEIRLFDLQTGKCFRKSTCNFPPVALEAHMLHPSGSLMLMSRNSSSEAGSQILVASALFDCRVFQWRLKDEWLAPGARARDQAAQHAQHATEGALDPGLDQGAFAAAAAPLAAQAAAHGAAGDNRNGAPSPAAATAVDEYSLRHVFTTPDFEPIVDISISTAARRTYVLGMENLYILGEDGVPEMTCNMASWRGVDPPPIGMFPYDVGAFSWPLPNSTRAAFYLDSTNSLFLAEFRAPMVNEVWSMVNPAANNAVPGRYPQVDHMVAWQTDDQGSITRSTSMFMQSHTDLRPAPRSANASSFTGRSTRPGDSEQVIVEYIQSGDVLFTGADSSCPGTASLLKAEKAAGTYLSGLGCSSVGKGGRGVPYVSRPGKGTSGTGRGGAGSSSGSLAPRALICIDSETGKRYKAIPIEGAIEAVHAAGQYIAIAVAPLEDYPEGSAGSIVVVDFTQEGFGLTDSQRAQQAVTKKGGLPPPSSAGAPTGTALKGAGDSKSKGGASASGGANGSGSSGGRKSGGGQGNGTASKSGGTGTGKGKGKRQCRLRGSDDK